MKTKTILKTDYSAKKCKEMEGHDGYVIRFDLCYKGKKVAEVYDDGNGGMVEISWVYYDNKTESMKVYQEGASKDFDALIEQIGEYEFMGEMSKYNDEVLVMEIYEDQRSEKQLKRLLKKKVLFINKENGKCGEFSWKGCKAITQKHIDVVKKDCSEIKVILNELPFNEALEQFKTATSK
tara:strand:- start:422 stop:961 length:540 start_codon:yes stop_codon:yes gene_type:complete